TICGSDDLTWANSTPGPDVGERTWPVIATRLHCACRCTGIACPGAAVIIDLRSPSEFTRDTDENSLIEPACVKVFDQGCAGLIVSICTETHGVEDLVVDRVILPVLNATAKRPAQLACDNLNARFHQTTGEQQLLPPSVTPVAVACRSIFF